MSLILRIQSAVGTWMVRPPLPPGRAASTRDEPDDPTPPVRDRTTGLSYFIQYAGGHISQRRITIRSLRIEDNQISHIYAHCHERGRARLFRTDRIEEVVDLETGEIFPVAELCKALMSRGIPVAEQRLAAMIRILVFMARCDGHAHHLEWEAIDRSVVRLARCLMDDDRAIEDMLADARRLAPDGEDFLRSLRGLKTTRLPARMHQELRRAIGAVIEADGRHHPSEVSWAMDADEYIRKMPTSG